MRLVFSFIHFNSSPKAAYKWLRYSLSVRAHKGRVGVTNMQVYIFDTNFFIDLVNLRERGVVQDIRAIFSSQRMQGLVTSHILGEVKDRIMRKKIEQAFHVIESPSADDPLFRSLNEYGTERKVLNRDHPTKYFKREFDPDLELLWLSMQIQQGKLDYGGEVPLSCSIVTDDEGIDKFHLDYCDAQGEDGNSCCEVIKSYIFLQRMLPLAPTEKARDNLQRAERAVFETRIDYKQSMGRTADLVKTIYQMRIEVMRQISQLPSRSWKNAAAWTLDDRDIVEQFLEEDEALDPPRFQQFLAQNANAESILQSLQDLIRESRAWSLELPVPENIYQEYYHLVLGVHAYRTGIRDGSAADIAPFFELLFVVDAKVFDIFLQIIAAFLKAADIARSIETMQLVSGHLTGLDTQAILAFQALLAFLWLAKGDKEMARNIIRGLQGESSASWSKANAQLEPQGHVLETKSPSFFQSIVKLLDLVEENFTTPDELEQFLTDTLKDLSACTDEPLSSEEPQECVRTLHNFALTLSSLGSPFSEKLLFVTTIGKKLCCVPPEEFAAAAEKYLEAAREAKVEVRSPEYFDHITVPKEEPEDE